MRNRQVDGKNPRDIHGDPEGVVVNAKQLHVTASFEILLKDIAVVLEREFPGWNWALNGDESGGIVNIFSQRLSMSWGYTLKTSTIQADTSLRCIRRAAGELIERFGYQAGPFRADLFKGGKRHLGLPVADVSDLARRRRRDYRTHAVQTAVQDGRARILTDSDIARARATVRS